MNRRDAIKALMAGLPATATLSAAKVEPDDVIVIETNRHLSLEARSHIAETMGRVWPGRKVVVLDGDMHMKIVKGQP